MSGTVLTVFQETARRLGARVLPDNAQWELRMLIQSETSDRLYTVARRKTDRTWGCDCPGWKRHRKCKHLTAMVPSLEAALRRTPLAAERPAPAQERGPRPAPNTRTTTAAPAQPDKPAAAQPADILASQRTAVEALLSASATLDQAVTAMLASDLRGVPEQVKLVRAAQANLRRAQLNIRFDHAAAS